jgi:hypothetical protein
MPMMTRRSYADDDELSDAAHALDGGGEYDYTKQLNCVPRNALT